MYYLDKLSCNKLLPHHHRAGLLDELVKFVHMVQVSDSPLIGNSFPTLKRHRNNYILFRSIDGPVACWND